MLLTTAIPINRVRIYAQIEYILVPTTTIRGFGFLKKNEGGGDDAKKTGKMYFFS